VLNRETVLGRDGDEVAGVRVRDRPATTGCLERTTDAEVKAKAADESLVGTKRRLGEVVARVVIRQFAGANVGEVAHLLGAPQV